MIKKLLSVSLLAACVSLPISALAGEVEHGLKIGYASNGDATIKGQHLNLYNPRDPSSWKQERTHAEEAKISDMTSIGYQYKNNFNGGPVALDLGISLSQVDMAAQTIRLVSQEGAFNVTSDQPDADARLLELYIGGTYQLASSGNYQPYIGAGVTLVTGKAHKTFYFLPDLLQGINTYGQSGSSNLDGTAVSVKAGVQIGDIAIELEHAQYDIQIDSFRSFEIDGADLTFDKTMLNMIFKIK